MSNFREVLERLQSYTGMYVLEETYTAVSAFIVGFNSAQDHVPLRGFREWLAVRLGGGANLSWEVLVLMLTFQEEDNPLESLKCGRLNQRIAIDALMNLIREFDHAREHSSVERIMADFNAMMRD